MVRIKHRYLLVKILYPQLPKTQSQVPETVAFHAPTADSFDSVTLARLIRRQITELFGDYGIGVVGGNLVVKYLSAATSTAIIRCPRDHYRLVWTALSTVTELPKLRDEPRDFGESGKSCVFRVIRVSGTMKKVEEEAIRQAKKQILQVRGRNENSGNNLVTKVTGGCDSVEAEEDRIRDSDSEMDEDSDG